MSSSAQLLLSSGLPSNGEDIVVLEGAPLGVNVMGRFKSSYVRSMIADIAAARDARHMSSQAIPKIAHNITSADVAALSFARNRNPEPWGNLLEDVLLWHVTRYVFEGVAIAWKSAEAAAELGGVADIKADGSVMVSGGPGGSTTLYSAAPGSELHTFATGGLCVAMSLPKANGVAPN
jgi:hypothetical protein